MRQYGTGLKIFHRFRLLLAMLALLLCLVQPRTASAVCENPGVASIAVGIWEGEDIVLFNLFIIQESSFDWSNMSTAYEHLAKAWVTFTSNVLTALNSFATNLNATGTAIGLRPMTMELHVSQVDQTYRLGQMQDAQLMLEEQNRTENYTNEAQKRYAPSDLACAMDTAGPGLSRAYQISRALNRTLALDDQPRRENAASGWPTICDSKIKYVDINGNEVPCDKGDGKWSNLPTTSFNGKDQDVNSTWNEYVAKYCDDTMGDQGCPTAPSGPTTSRPIAGRHKDIGALLWGSQLTIDPTNQENIRMMQANLRFLIDPLAPDPIPETVVPMPGVVVSQAAQGRTGILERHAEMAYINTIYNTLGAMLTERIGGSKVDVSLMRAAAGLPTADTTPGTLRDVGASYREITEAMTRDRFEDPQYLIKMLGNPEQVARERNTLNALRLQTMNDTYRRQEEMLIMEAAEYGRDLNSQIPHAEITKKSFKKLQ